MDWCEICEYYQETRHSLVNCKYRDTIIFDYRDCPKFDQAVGTVLHMPERGKPR
jgi:hypothetical protein